MDILLSNRTRRGVSAITISEISAGRLRFTPCLCWSARDDSRHTQKWLSVEGIMGPCTVMYMYVALPLVQVRGLGCVTDTLRRYLRDRTHDP